MGRLHDLPDQCRDTQGARNDRYLVLELTYLLEAFIRKAAQHMKTQQLRHIKKEKGKAASQISGKRILHKQNSNCSMRPSARSFVVSSNVEFGSSPPWTRQTQQNAFEVGEES